MRKLFICLLLLSTGISAFGSEKYIITMVYANDADTVYINALRNAGYVVHAEKSYWYFLTEEKKDILNDFHLVIITRPTTSIRVADGDGPLTALWRQVTTPVITMNNFITRSSRAQYFNTTSAKDYVATQMLAVDTLHPVFEGIELDENKLTNVLIDEAEFGYCINPGVKDAGNGKVIAVTPGTLSDTSLQHVVSIAEWDADTVFYAELGDSANNSGRRMWFAGTREEGMYNADGKKLFLNAVEYMLPDSIPETVPDVDLGLDPDPDPDPDTSLTRPVGPGEWDRIRRYGHAMERNDFTDEQYAYIDENIYIITLEKIHGTSAYDRPCLELATANTAANLKNTKVLLYFQAFYPFHFWETVSAAKVTNPEYFVEDDGQDSLCFNFGNPDALDWWAGISDSLVNNTQVAGTFVDAIGKISTHNHSNWLPALYEKLPQMDGITIHNGGLEVLPYSDGFLKEDIFTGSASDMRNWFDDLLALPDDKYMFLNSFHANYLFPLAGFLIVAHNKSFFRYYDLVNGSHSRRWGDVLWHCEEYDKPLGQPLGKGKRVSEWVYKRSFEHADVTVDLYWSSASIEWYTPMDVPTIHDPQERKDTICQGESVQIGESVFTQTGIYSVTFENQFGRDSVIDLSLHVLDSPQVEFSKDTTIISGESITLDAGEGFASYLWNTGESDRSIAIDSMAGIGEHPYWVLVSGSNGCMASDTIIITIQEAMNSINIAAESGTIILYPNPTNGQLFIESDNVFGKIDLSIYSISGQRMLDKKYNYERINDEIDISDFSKGIYLVYIQYGNETIIKKLTLQ